MLHEVNVAKKARLALLAGASAAVPGAEAASANPYSAYKVLLWQRMSRAADCGIESTGDAISC